MPFIRQVRQIGKPGGAALGRVFPVDTIANQFHGLENIYVPGAGVGSVSGSNRRALMRRAYNFHNLPPNLTAFIVPSEKTLNNPAFLPTALPGPTAPCISNGAITYSSSNPAVATINSTSGLVTLVGVGTVTFTAVQAAYAKYLSSTVTSNTLTVSIIPATLSAFIVPSKNTLYNSAFFPTALPGPTAPHIGTGVITYSSSNPAVATIDSTSGLITLIGVGAVTFVAVQAADTNYLSTTVTSNTLTVYTLEAPTAVSGVGGDTVGYIIFTEPSAAGKPAITNYEYSVDGSDFFVLDPPQTFSPIMIPGLTNGTTYTAKIRAVNSDGAGAESVSSSSFVPDTNTLYETNRLVRLEAGETLSYGGTGTEWTNLDSAGSYSATLQNAPTYQSATTPKYFSFNGTNQIAEIAAAAAINPTVGSSFTLQIWAKVNTTSPNFSAWDGLISKQSNLNTYDGYSLSLSSSTTINLNMNGLSKNDSYGPLVSNAYSGNVWELYTIVVRYGGGSANPSLVYVNGRLVVTGNNEETGSPAAAPLQFPRGIQEGATNFAPADVGAFYVYNTALSQETIIRNFDATKPTYGV